MDEAKLYSKIISEVRPIFPGSWVYQKAGRRTDIELSFFFKNIMLFTIVAHKKYPFNFDINETKLELGNFSSNDLDNVINYAKKLLYLKKVRMKVRGTQYYDLVYNPGMR